LKAYALPGVSGLAYAPITASVARVAFNTFDSNHLSRMYLEEKIKTNKKKKKKKVGGIS